MCSWGRTVKLKPPSRCLIPNRIANDWIKVDGCLAMAVAALWFFGYATLASCCGHGQLHGEIVVMA